MPPTFTDEGLRAAAAIEDQAARAGVVVLSQYVEATWAVRLMDRRTRGTAYLLKDRIADLDLLDETVRTVASGGSAVDELIVERLLRRQSAALSRLTDRERTVLALMAAGRSNAAIATDLTLTAKTVESHVRAIFQKLDVAADDDGHKRVRAVLTYLEAAG
jgi:DNA-binding NarL/FixJ family response regulator